MSDQYDCLEVAALLPELAVGAAAGDERGRALAHVSRCVHCRRELGSFAATADAVLLLVPPVEPPPGFETATLARLGGARPTGPDAPVPIRRPRWRARRLLAVAVAAAAALLIALGGGAALTHWRGADDRELADQYRRTLAVANGRYLKAAPLTSADGQRVGTSFLYQGSPSWLLVTVTGAPDDGDYAVLAIDRRGGAHRLGVGQITNHVGTAGFRLPVRVRDVAQVQLRSTDDTTVTPAILTSTL